MELDVDLIFDKSTPLLLLLSIGYGNAHIVSQIPGKETVENILEFIATYKAEKGAHWVEMGHFGSCPITLTLTNDTIAVIMDSDLRVGGFGQSAGLYIPRELLDGFVVALSEARRGFINKR